jgi:large subunit ribosomal protein L4
MALTAPVIGGAKRDVALDAAVFEAEVKPHLLHETVRAEQNAHRAGTRGAKSRGLVSGGRSKPWRQKGTGRARQGTIRAPQFTGGGVAFPPGMRSFEVKVNRKARRAALRGALSHHAANGTIALIDGSGLAEPSTKQALELLDGWRRERPVLVVAHEDEEALVKSFRNLERVLVTVPAELEVAAVVWARSVLVTEAALPLVEARAGHGKEEEAAT